MYWLDTNRGYMAKKIKQKSFNERLEAFREDLQKSMVSHGVTLKEFPVIKPDGTLSAEIKVIDLQTQDGK